jgi:uncharacterized protein YegL
MKKDLTEIIAILDNSGSMAELVNDTVGGYNAFINNQKNIPGEAILSTVLFNTDYTILHDRVNIKEVKPITNDDYHTGGGTALLDAMGKTINNIGLKLQDIVEDERPDKVIVFIITDGEENSSKEFTHKKIKEMVELKKNICNWEFLFAGANIDSFSVAKSIGISYNLVFSYESKCVDKVYCVMDEAVMSLRKRGDIDKGKNFRKKIK